MNKTSQQLSVLNRKYEAIPTYTEDLSSLLGYQIKDDVGADVFFLETDKWFTQYNLENAIYENILKSQAAINSNHIPGGMLNLFKDITKRLDSYTTVVPFDDFTRMCSFVAQSFNLDVAEAQTAITNIMNELGLKAGPTGQEEEWLGQKRTAPFGMQDPGFLAQPLSYKEVKQLKIARTFSEGDKVELRYTDTRDLATKGHVLKVNKDSTCDVMASNGEVYQNIDPSKLHEPSDEGGRIGGENYGYFDSPRNLATTDVINDNPSAYADAKGQEGQTVSDVPNPSLNE